MRLDEHELVFRCAYLAGTTSVVGREKFCSGDEIWRLVWSVNNLLCKFQFHYHYCCVWLGWGWDMCLVWRRDRIGLGWFWMVDSLTVEIEGSEIIIGRKVENFQKQNQCELWLILASILLLSLFIDQKLGPFIKKSIYHTAYFILISRKNLF